MSGGAFNYCYARVRDAAWYVHDPEIKQLLEDLSVLLYEEEWYYSGDTCTEDYMKALREFKDKWLGGTDARFVRVLQLTDEIYREAHEKVQDLLGVGGDA